MKQDTAILSTKAVCYMLIGALTPLATSLAQWANSEQWPPAIVWVVIIAGCVVGGCTQLLSFLSGSYSDYLKSRNGNGHVPPPVDKPAPVNQVQPVT